MLAGLTFERRARVIVTSTDRNGRLIGRVFVRSHDINAEMVRRGGAWVYVRYLADPALPELEAQAREARRGLWALPEAQRVPPREWRGRRRPP
jgi:endonuclease YncB( thermonuclease family)